MPLHDSLPPSTFLPTASYDPLLHNTQDLFWYHVEPYFHPIGIQDLEQLQPTHVETPALPSLALLNEQPHAHHDPALSSLATFPLAQRITAAFLDEGKGHLSASKIVRPNLAPEETWLGTTPEALHQFNRVWEDRLRIELEQAELLDPQQDDLLLTEIRLNHWHLRNINAINNTAQRAIESNIATELETQAARRENKVQRDQQEIRYLEKMIEKGGKRGKGRFAKLLNQMHPNRNLQPGQPIQSSKLGSSAVADGNPSKKRKKKASGSDRIGFKHSDHPMPPITDASDNLAPHIADIIWKHNNQAPIDEIVKEFLERVPHLAGDIKEARRRITNCMSFSRKPFRFRKQADGVTYSATRV